MVDMYFAMTVWQVFNISSILPVSEGVGAAVWEGETAFGGW